MHADPKSLACIVWATLTAHLIFSAVHTTTGLSHYLWWSYSIVYCSWGYVPWITSHWQWLCLQGIANNSENAKLVFTVSFARQWEKWLTSFPIFCCNLLNSYSFFSNDSANISLLEIWNNANKGQSTQWQVHKISYILPNWMSTVYWNTSRFR